MSPPMWRGDFAQIFMLIRRTEKVTPRFVGAPGSA